MKIASRTIGATATHENRSGGSGGSEPQYGIWSRLLGWVSRAVYKLAVHGQQRTIELQFARHAVLSRAVRVTRDAGIRNLSGNPLRIRVGEYSCLRGELLVFGHSGEITIGHSCYVGEGTRIWSMERVVIGNRVLISHDVNIHDTNSHSLEPTIRHRDYLRLITDGHSQEAEDDVATAPVSIADDVWIGFGASILKGVMIGQGAIVAAGAVVIDDVPPAVVVAGNPAQVVKQL